MLRVHLKVTVILFLLTFFAIAILHSQIICVTSCVKEIHRLIYSIKIKCSLSLQNGGEAKRTYNYE